MRTVGKVLLLFAVVPLVELYLLLTIGRLVGFWPTVAIVLVTGTVGAWLARREGLRVMRRWREDLAQGRMPEEGVLSGVLVLVGGVLLITPGVLTDITGLLLLLPPTRRVVARHIRARLERAMAAGTIHVVTVGPPGQPRPGGDPGVIDIEGDVVDVAPREPARQIQS